MVRKIDLNHFEKKIYSQNGEDGVIEKIFELIGTDSKYYVEFGVEDGLERNTRALMTYHGWKGLLMDGRFENSSINLKQMFITKENINQLFNTYGVPVNLDLLSIDIDYNDFYIWQAIDDRYKPRLVIIEYNASHLPKEDCVVPYNPLGCWDKTNYYGASILALYNLGRKKGYSLIYAETMGVNLFFVRDDLLKDKAFHFKNTNDVINLYAFPEYGDGPLGGHRQDPHLRQFIKSTDVIC